MQCGAATQKGGKCKIRIDFTPCRFHKSQKVVVETDIDIRWPKIEDFWSNYEYCKNLGEGSFGKVILIKDKNQELFALKILKEKNGSFKDDSVVLEHLHHRCIVACHKRVIIPYPPPGVKDDKIQETEVRALVMQYIEGKTLRSWPCAEHDSLTILKLLKGALETLKYIHSVNIIHGDIKPANFIVRNDIHEIVFLDFGISHRVINRKATIFAKNFTPNFSAPELFNYNLKRDFNFFVKTDIFSLGATFYKILTKKNPKWIVNEQKWMFDVKVFKEAMLEFEAPHDQTQLYRTIKSMLEFAPDDRPSIDDILKNIDC